MRTQGKVQKDGPKYVMEGAITLLTVSLYPCLSCFYPEISGGFMRWNPQGHGLGKENLLAAGSETRLAAAGTSSKGAC